MAEIDRSTFEGMNRMDRRRFLGGLLGCAVAAALPLPVGLSDPAVIPTVFRLEVAWDPDNLIVFVNGVRQTEGDQKPSVSSWQLMRAT